MFIQGVNAMSAHAPHVVGDKVQPFVFFSLANVRPGLEIHRISFAQIENQLRLIHHHHHLEETYYFDKLEEKLGKGYLESTKEEHDTFVPQIEAAEKWLSDVQSGKEQYNPRTMVELIDSFSDKMFEHLSHVCLKLFPQHDRAILTLPQEPGKLNSEKMRQNFTEKELKDIDEEFFKLALKGVDYYTMLPLGLISTNPATPW